MDYLLYGLSGILVVFLIVLIVYKVKSNSKEKFDCCNFNTTCGSTHAVARPDLASLFYA